MDDIPWPIVIIIMLILAVSIKDDRERELTSGVKMKQVSVKGRAVFEITRKYTAVYEDGELKGIKLISSSTAKVSP